jgi:uncharacterized protein YlxP (DUF503 family)
MYVGLLVIDCRIGEEHSLKEKRHVLQSFTEHLKRKFNISVAEVEHQDLWQRTKLAIACVNTNPREGRSTLDHICNAIEADPRLQIIDSEIVQLC